MHVRMLPCAQTGQHDHVNLLHAILRYIFQDLSMDAWGLPISEYWKNMELGLWYLKQIKQKKPSVLINIFCNWLLLNVYVKLNWDAYLIWKDFFLWNCLFFLMHVLVLYIMLIRKPITHLNLGFLYTCFMCCFVVVQHLVS
jgi:hypothetical protein